MIPSPEEVHVRPAFVASVVASLLVAPVPAAAQFRLFEPCSADAARLCAEVPAGEGRLVRCLAGRWADLSPDCRSDLGKVEAAVTPAVAPVRVTNAPVPVTEAPVQLAPPAPPAPQPAPPRNAVEVCKPDLDRFCKGGDRTLGVASECLMDHRQELEHDCRIEVEKGLQKVGDYIRACGADAMAFCADVPQREGPVLKCLAGRRADISPGCRALVESAEARLTAFVEACRTDIARRCGAQEHGGGRALICVGEHRAEVSQACREAFDQVGNWDE